MAIITFEPIRQKYVFRSCSIRINAEKIYFPCIALYEKQTNIVVACPGFERWYLKLAECEAMATATMRKRSYNICTFLNFWLWNTKYDTLNELTITDIRNFIIGFKALDNGTERDLESWNRGIADVYNFLIRYYEYNKDLLEFSFSPEDLFTVNVIRDSKTGKKSIIRKYNKFSTKAPAKLEKKNRLLVHIQLVVCGDFCQLPPVLTLSETKILTEYYKRPIGMGYAFLADEWKRTFKKTIYLTKTVRQSDEEYIQALNQIRLGDVSGIDYVNTHAKYGLKDGVLELYPFNRDVAKANLFQLEKLSEQKVNFHVIVSCKVNRRVASSESN